MCGPAAPKAWATAKNTAIAWARISRGKISLTVRYAELAPAEAKKKITLHQIVCDVAVRRPASKSAALMARSAAEIRYVPAIMTRRPHVSKRCPSTRGPARLPAANANRYHGALPAET